MSSTVVSVVEILTQGGKVITRPAAMTAAEAFSFQTANWLSRLKQLKHSADYVKYLTETYGQGGRFASAAFQRAMGQLAAEEAAARTLATAAAEASAAEGTLIAGVGVEIASVALPVISLVAVGLALGAPYYQARQEAKKEGYAMGFAEGFVIGILQWPVHITINLFWDNAVAKNSFDEVIPAIRATSFNTGLLKGRLAGITLDDAMKKKYHGALKKLTTTSTAGWTPKSDDWAEKERAHKVQISYVIDLATAARKHGIIKADE